MKNVLATLIALVSCIGFARPAHAEDHAKVSEIASASSIAAGKPFMLGFKFKIDAGWHIYWKNPGDAGIATDIKLNLPQGFTAGEIQFPVPKRIVLPGDIVNYAYEDEVMLMVQVTPPKDLSAGKTTISAKCSWLVCKEDCIPGSADTTLDLAVASTSTSANEEAFAQWTKALPLKEDAANISAVAKSLSLANGDGQATISINWKKTPTDIQFLPGPMDNGFAQNVKVVTTGDSTKITFDIKGSKTGDPVSGLVTYTTAAGIKTGLEMIVAGDAK